MKPNVKKKSALNDNQTLTKLVGDDRESQEVIKDVVMQLFNAGATAVGVRRSSTNPKEVNEKRNPKKDDVFRL